MVDNAPNSKYMYFLLGPYMYLCLPILLVPIKICKVLEGLPGL